MNLVGLLSLERIVLGTMSPAATSGVVTDGLILHLDAAAQVERGGLGPENNVWQNLANQPDEVAGSGVLRHFKFDGSTGWFGSGTPDDPYALRFDGQQAYVIGPGNLERTEITLEAWAQVEGCQGRPTRRGATLIGNDFGRGGLSLMIMPSTGSPLLLHGVTFTPVDAETPPQQWQQVVVSLQNDLARLYVNGVLATVLPAPRELQMDHYPGYQLGVARHPQNDFVEADGLIGSLAIVRVYHRALSALEVRRNFEADHARFGLNLVWPSSEPIRALPLPEVPGLGPAPPVRCLKWDYYTHPVRVSALGPQGWPYGARQAFNGYPTSLAQPYVRNYWRTDPPTADQPASVTVNYQRPVAVTRYVHYYDRFRTPCAWKDVDVLTSDDQETWTLRQRFTDLPPDCPQVLGLDQPVTAQYYRIVVKSLADGAPRIATHEIETYYGATIGNVVSALVVRHESAVPALVVRHPERDVKDRAVSAVQSEPCQLRVCVVSPDAPFDEGVLKLVAPSDSLQGSLETALPAVAEGGGSVATFTVTPLRSGLIPVFIELHVGGFLIDRRPYTLRVQPKLAFQGLTPVGAVVAPAGESVMVKGSLVNAGSQPASDVKVAWMGDTVRLGDLAPGQSASFELQARARLGYHEGAVVATASTCWEGVALPTTSAKTVLRRSVICPKDDQFSVSAGSLQSDWTVAGNDLKMSFRLEELASPVTGTLRLFASSQPCPLIPVGTDRTSQTLAAAVPGGVFLVKVGTRDEGGGTVTEGTWITKARKGAKPRSAKARKIRFGGLGVSAVQKTNNHGSRITDHGSRITDLVLKCSALPDDPHPLTPPFLDLELRLAVDQPKVMFRPHIDWYTVDHGPNFPAVTNGHHSATRMLCIQTAEATVSMVPDTDNLTWGFTPDHQMTAAFQIPLASYDPLGQPRGNGTTVPDYKPWRPIYEAPTGFNLVLPVRKGDWWEAYRYVVTQLFHFEQPRQWAMPLTQMQMLNARYVMRQEVWSERWQTVRSHPWFDFFYNFYGTTYTLPTLYSWYLATDDPTAKVKAEKVVDWLLSVQQKEGPAAGAWFSQYGVENDPPELVGRDQAWNRWVVPHSTGTAAKTLLWYWEASGRKDGRVFRAARRGCDWLVATQRPDGGWPYAFDLEGKPITDLSDAGQIWCTWALWKMFEYTGEEKYKEAAVRSRDFFQRTFMEVHRYQGYWEDVSGAGGQVARSWEGYEPAIAALVFADMGETIWSAEASASAIWSAEASASASGVRKPLLPHLECGSLYFRRSGVRKPLLPPGD